MIIWSPIIQLVSHKFSYNLSKNKDLSILNGNTKKPVIPNG